MNRRGAFLKEMGLGSVWTLRQASSTLPHEMSLPLAVECLASNITVPTATMELSDRLPLEENNSADDGFASDVTPPFFDAIPWEEGFKSDSMQEVSIMDWEQLEAAIVKCTACGLCEGRTRAVPGIGDRKAAWLFIGEGPGYSEDQQGEPFVGSSGKLLDNMLLAMNLKRGADTYIANIVKCRPTDENGRDRPPTQHEANACRPFLERQIALIQPKIIVALGRTAATMLLGSEPQTSLASLRGKRHEYATSEGHGISLVATYHPAYLLRQLSDKKKVWSDLCLAMNQDSPLKPFQGE